LNVPLAATTFDSWFRARHPDIRLGGAHSVLKLAEEGATVPFIARYRKEQTGNLDEVQIERTLEARELWERITNRQTVILESIERQKKLTPELKEKILSAFELDVLEDLYLPFKQKRKSKAAQAREAGLQPLADWIWDCGHGLDRPQPGQTLELWAFTFRDEEKGIKDPEAAVLGARDILVERLAEIPELRAGVRKAIFESAYVRSTLAGKAKPNSKYEHYFRFQERITSLREPQNSHRYLALRRGAAEEEITLQVVGPPEDPDFEAGLLRTFEAAACNVPDSPGAAVLAKAASLALKEHVLPSVENEAHHSLKEAADEAAIRVFAENVRRLLLASPFGARPVLGVDPGLRTGCKLAAVDAAGAFVRSDLIHLESEEGKAQAGPRLAEIVRGDGIQAVAVGNGTAGRETEIFVRHALQEQALTIPVVMVSEAGASVYSASEVAREELPSLDVTVRGAISIARRLQDPLAELVKIEPRSIGVGQYQHDVAGKALEKSLERVVDSCVNQVGVNLNTASPHLLAHVSGIGPALARAIVEHRAQKGLFPSRAALLTVPRFNSKTFEQAAGFLRIPGGEHPLDNTSVHPERYAALEGLATRLGKGVADLLGPGVELVRQAGLAEEVGAFTFEDILKELEKPGRDPRTAFVPFAFREDVHDLPDLKPGMACPGIVTNVTNFGAFVDIGVHQDGLVHISQLGAQFVKDPRDVVSPGDRVTARVLQVNLEKKQISLSLKPAPPERKPQHPRRREARATPPPAPAPASRPAPRPAGPQARPAPRREVSRPPAGARRPPAPRPTPRSRAAPPLDKVPPAFNNPFAVLARLKGPGKGRPEEGG
jgi:uncharacterized protein